MSTIKLIKPILVPAYTGKGDPLVCSSYRAIKLLEQLMKVLERVLEKSVKCQMSIDNMQFGFIPGKGTTDAIFIMRQEQERHQVRKKLYYAFVDLEKAFDRVAVSVCPHQPPVSVIPGCPGPENSVPVSS